MNISPIEVPRDVKEYVRVHSGVFNGHDRCARCKRGLHLLELLDASPNDGNLRRAIAETSLHPCGDYRPLAGELRVSEGYAGKYEEECFGDDDERSKMSDAARDRFEVLFSRLPD